MCRLAAFPPGFSRTKALDILSNFEKGNTDGTGSAFVSRGQFVIDKWAQPLTKVIKNKSFLSHMPYDGWTIAHLRAASHGENKTVNTHPFVVGPWAFIHNGVWSDYEIVKLALSKQVKFEGETDSEVAAQLWNLIGPKTFAEKIDFSGVFMGLNIRGDLWVAKTSGDLEIKALRNKQVLLASEFDHEKYTKLVEALHGWYHFNKKGEYVKHKENKESWSASYSTNKRVVGSFPHGNPTVQTDYFGARYRSSVSNHSEYDSRVSNFAREWRD